MAGILFLAAVAMQLKCIVCLTTFLEIFSCIVKTFNMTKRNENILDSGKVMNVPLKSEVCFYDAVRGNLTSLSLSRVLSSVMHNTGGHSKHVHHSGNDLPQV